MGLKYTPGVIDIVSFLIIIRIIYIAYSRGAINEFIKLIGLSIASFLSLQYYSSLDTIAVNVPFNIINRTVVRTGLFLFIFLGALFLVTLILHVVRLFFKKETYSFGNRLLASVLGSVRVILFLSIMMFFLNFFTPTRKLIEKGISYKIVKPIASLFYREVFKLYKKINPQAYLNKEVEEYYEIEKDL